MITDVIIYYNYQIHYYRLQHHHQIYLPDNMKRGMNTTPHWILIFTAVSPGSGPSLQCLLPTSHHLKTFSNLQDTSTRMNERPVQRSGTRALVKSTRGHRMKILQKKPTKYVFRYRNKVISSSQFLFSFANVICCEEWQGYRVHSAGMRFPFFIPSLLLSILLSCISFTSCSSSSPPLRPLPLLSNPPPSSAYFFLG